MAEHPGQGLRLTADIDEAQDPQSRMEVDLARASPPPPLDAPITPTKTLGSLVEAMGSLSFAAAAEQTFMAYQTREAVPTKRQLYLNPMGGVHEIAEAASTYRRHARRQGRLMVLWLASALGMCAINTYELVVPNILQVQELLEMENMNDFMQRTDLAKGMTFVMAFYEMIGCGLLFFGILYSLLASYFRYDFGKWRNLANLAWVWLPTLSRFSAIKMLGKCHPKTVLTDLQDLMEAHEIEQDIEEDGCCRFLTSRQILYVVQMVLWKTLVLLAGLAALCIKTQKLSALLNKQETAIWRILLQVVGVTGYVNQCLNIVDVAGLLKREALRFSFAGEDATYQRKELVYKAVFAACVAKGIWETIAKSRGRLYAFAALYTFDHKDVQRLALGSEEFNVKRCFVKPQPSPKVSPA